MLAVVLGMFSACVATVSAGVASYQVVTMRRISLAELSTHSIMDFWSRQNREARSVVRALGDKPFSEWTQEELEAADVTAAQMSSMGLLIKGNLVMKDEFLDFYSGWCVSLFNRISPLVAARRREYGAPDQWVYFEWLARQACLHRRRTPWWRGGEWARLKEATPDVRDPSRFPFEED